MNASQPTPQKPVERTATARFKSALDRLFGAKPVDKSGSTEPKPTVTYAQSTYAQTIWSKEWCAQEPALASAAIAALQDRVQILEDYIASRIDRPRKIRVSKNPKGVYLSTVPPNTYFKLLRTGEVFRTSPSGWKTQYQYKTNAAHHLHGGSRVVFIREQNT